MNSDRRTIADIVVAGARHALAVATGVLTIGLVARRLGPDALGAWALLGTASFLLGAADLGLSTAVQRAAVQRDPAPARRVTALALLAIAVVAPTAAVLSYVFLLDVPGAAPALRADVDRAGVLVMIAGVVAAAAFPYRGFALVRGGMRALAGAKAAAAAAQVTITATWLWLQPTLLAPAAGLLAAALLETALSVRVARGLDPALPLLPARPASRGEIVTALRDGAAALAINLSVLAAVRADVVVLAHVAPLALVAAYGVASRAVDQSYTLAKQVSAALLPKLGDPGARGGAVRLGTAVLGVLVASGMPALALDGQGMLVAWAGPVAARPQAAVALALLGGAAMIAATHELVASALMLGGRTAWATATPIVLGSAVNVALLLGLARVAPVWAAAGGNVLGNVVVSVMVWSRARRLLGWTARDVAGAVAPAAAAGAASLGVGWALAGAGAAGLAGSVAACALTTACGLAAGAAVARGRPASAPVIAGEQCSP
jgi:hypothetical protein